MRVSATGVLSVPLRRAYLTGTPGHRRGRRARLAAVVALPDADPGVAIVQVLGLQLELVDVQAPQASAPLRGAAADGLEAVLAAVFLVVLGVGLGGRRIELEDAAEEGAQKLGAGGDDADV